MKHETRKSILMFGVLCTGLAFLPSTLLLCFAMLPSVVAHIIDRSLQRSKAFSVGILNFAGALPFLLALWSKGNDVGTVLDILRQPITITVIYAIAGCGYLVESVVTDIVAKVMMQKSNMRIKAILSRQEDLKDRWGDYVDGATPLDDYGFPFDSVSKR